MENLSAASLLFAGFMLGCSWLAPIHTQLRPLIDCQFGNEQKLWTGRPSCLISEGQRVPPIQAVFMRQLYYYYYYLLIILLMFILYCNREHWSFIHISMYCTWRKFRVKLGEIRSITFWLDLIGSHVHEKRSERNVPTRTSWVLFLYLFILMVLIK